MRILHGKSRRPGRAPGSKWGPSVARHSVISVAAIAYDRRRIPQPRQTMTDKPLFAAALLFAAMAFMGSRAAAADIKVLTAGAFKQIVVALAPEFEKQTGHKVAIENETVGALVKKIEGGEAFDVTFLSPAAVDDLIKKGKLADGSRVNIARVGVGVMVKEGAPKPRVGTGAG